MVKSFNTVNNSSQPGPAATSLTDVVLETFPLVSNDDIAYYTKSTTTFKLRKDIGTTIYNYAGDKAFAVVVDDVPVYYGLFRPGYYSSIVFGIASIDPILYNDKNLKIEFVKLTPDPFTALDKRNDDRLINALQATGRLR